MSIELPEAQILSRQMNIELVGKQVVTCQLQNYQNFQRLGFINKDISATPKNAVYTLKNLTN